MADKWTNSMIKDYVLDEGLGYAIMYGVSSDDFEDENLKELWADAASCLQEITNYLKLEEE